MAKPSSRLRRFIGETSLQWAVDIMPRMPDSLRALLVNLIDYAGLCPPAGLALPAVLENYETYLASPESWMLNRLVLPAAKLPEAPLGDNWRVTLLVEGEPGPLSAQVETLETFAKVRTGGLTPEAIQSSEALADFLGEAASRHIAFKATAGLHHPIRSLHPLTYAPELNPTEYIWGHLKHHELANRCAGDFAGLKTGARNRLRSMQRRPTLIRAFWQQAELPL